jgi:hypothetical protein
VLKLKVLNNGVHELDFMMMRSIVSLIHSWIVMKIVGKEYWPQEITANTDESRRKKKFFWCRQLTGNIAFGAIIFAVNRVPIGIAMVLK